MAVIDTGVLAHPDLQGQALTVVAEAQVPSLVGPSGLLETAFVRYGSYFYC